MMYVDRPGKVRGWLTGTLRSHARPLSLQTGGLATNAAVGISVFRVNFPMNFRIVLTGMMLLVCAACAKEDSLVVSSGLTGTWELREIYADPGDGSGTFQPVTSDKVIVFRPDGSFRSNGSFCQNLGNTDGEGRGSYSVGDSTLSPDCDAPRPLPLVLRGDTLDIYFFCIEGCGERYRKVSDGEGF